MVVALRYLACFSYRWSYYDNFGVQHLVLQKSVHSVLMSAIELILDPRSASLTLIWVALPLLAQNSVFAVAASLPLPAKRLRFVGLAVKVFGFDSSFLRDVLRAAILMYGCFMVSSEIGSAAFRRDVADGPSNPLPRVTLLFSRGPDDSASALGCGLSDLQNIRVVGDAEGLATIQRFRRTCDSDTMTWRLLYRDDKFTYVFASQPAELIAGARPLSIMVPNDTKALIIAQ